MLYGKFCLASLSVPGMRPGLKQGVLWAFRYVRRQPVLMLYPAIDQDVLRLNVPYSLAEPYQERASVVVYLAGGSALDCHHWRMLRDALKTEFKRALVRP